VRPLSVAVRINSARICSIPAIEIRCGNYGVLAWSEAQNSGTHGRQLDARSHSRGWNVTYSESIRPLIRPEECPASAPVRQKRQVEEGRVSGPS
jgi:hypothetical protein